MKKFASTNLIGSDTLTSVKYLGKSSAMPLISAATGWRFLRIMRHNSLTEANVFRNKTFADISSKL